MATIYIDNKAYDVREGQNLLHTILSLGIDLPYFCWHPALGSVGACRQCAVIQYKDEDDKKGKLVMACLIPVKDGLRCSVKAPEAAEFREHIIEWLMVNHPHDCPVCDEGGECHLQDMTVMSGHNYRRYRFSKRTHRNQDLGPFIYHEMNRCITCYRCVRFYHDFAGGDDLQAFGAHDHVYFGRYEDGPLESEFSGNLVEVCPTGVFTDKTLRQHYTRKWDLQSGPSICQHCGLGCNTLAGERYGKLVRILNRYNSSVNGYFICDRGRFGYEFVNSEKRLLTSRLKTHVTDDDSRDKTLDAAREAVVNGKRVIGIGSPRASLETNFALRTLVGRGNFYHGVTRQQSRIIEAIINELRTGPARSASLRDIESADAVLVLGEDLTNTAPMLALAVRQAVRNQPLKQVEKQHIMRWQDAAVREMLQDQHGPFYQANVSSTKLDTIATASPTMAPQDIARFGFAIAHAIDDKAPSVDDLPDELHKLAQDVADALKDAERPVIIAGGSLGDESIVHAAANCARALIATAAKGEIAYVVPECNSMGLGMLDGSDAKTALDRIESGDVDTLIVAECNLYRLFSAERLEPVLSKINTIVCLDYLDTSTAQRADIALPVATFAEGDGTIVNSEGRAQRYFQALDPSEHIQEAWKWLAELMAARGMDNAPQFQRLDGAAQAVFDFLGERHDLTSIAPAADFRLHGVKIARSPHRFSGRTAMLAHVNVSEPKPPDDNDAPLSFSMEGAHDRQPGSLIPFFWSPGWNSVQSTQHYMKEIGAELRGGDPGLRLFEPNGNSDTTYHTNIPSSFAKAPDTPLAVPLYRIFGSEELSNESAPVQTRIPQAFAAMNEKTLSDTGCTPDESATFNVDAQSVTLTVRRDDRVPDGVVGIVAGYTDLPPLALPARVAVSRSTT